MTSALSANPQSAIRDPQFYSEFGEDAWIAANLPLPKTGYYIDLGCAHPTLSSNTAFLRDRHWPGLAIDANPGFAPFWAELYPAALPNDRRPALNPFLAAIISDRPIVTFEYKQEAILESRVTPGATRHAAVRLSHLTHLPCDFLSLDLEGHEYEALRSIPPPHLPPIIVSEYATTGLPDDMRVRDYLVMSGYRLAHTTPANHIFHRDR